MQNIKEKNNIFILIIKSIILLFIIDIISSPTFFILSFIYNYSVVEKIKDVLFFYFLMNLVMFPILYIEFKDYNQRKENNEVNNGEESYEK